MCMSVPVFVLSTHKHRDKTMTRRRKVINCESCLIALHLTSPFRQVCVCVCIFLSVIAPDLCVCWLLCVCWPLYLCWPLCVCWSVCVWETPHYIAFISSLSSPLPPASVHLSHAAAQTTTSNKYEHKSERLLGLAAVWSVCFCAIFCALYVSLVCLVLGLLVCAYEYFCFICMHIHNTGEIKNAPKAPTTLMSDCLYECLCACWWVQRVEWW